MLYTEFMNKVCNSCIYTNEITGKSFIAPCYKLYMKEDGLDPKDVTDIEITFADVREYMELEIKRRDILTDNTTNLINYISDFIFNKVDPAIEEKANETAKDLIEYFKMKKELEEKKEEEKNLSNKNNDKLVKYNFSKKAIK